jgi:hypothetical protein
VLLVQVLVVLQIEAAYASSPVKSVGTRISSNTSALMGSTK